MDFAPLRDRPILGAGTAVPVRTVKKCMLKKKIALRQNCKFAVEIRTKRVSWKVIFGTRFRPVPLGQNKKTSVFLRRHKTVVFTVF